MFVLASRMPRKWVCSSPSCLSGRAGDVLGGARRDMVLGVVCDGELLDSGKQLYRITKSRACAFER